MVPPPQGWFAFWGRLGASLGRLGDGSLHEPWLHEPWRAVRAAESREASASDPSTGVSSPISSRSSCSSRRWRAPGRATPGTP